MQRPSRGGRILRLTHPIDDGALKPPPPKTTVCPRYNPGNHSIFHNDSTLWLCPDCFVFPFSLHEGNMADKIVSGLRVRGVTRARLTRSARERSDGRSCQRHCLLLGTQRSSTLDSSPERPLPRSRAIDQNAHAGDAPPSSSATSHHDTTIIMHQGGSGHVLHCTVSSDDVAMIPL